MSQDSAPGKDGLPMEFYQSFLHLKIEDFTNLVNFIFFAQKEMRKTMKTAILSHIPKTAPTTPN